MPLELIKVKIPLNEYLESCRKYGFLCGVLEGLKWRVDKKTCTLIDKVLKEIESDRFKCKIETY